MKINNFKDFYTEKTLNENDDMDDFGEDILDDGGDEMPDFEDKVEKKPKTRKSKPKKGEKNIIRSEEGNVKIRMTSRLKKMFKKLETLNDSRKISSKFLKGIRKVETDISFFDMIDDKGRYLSFLPKNRIVGMERTKDKNGKMRLNSYKSKQREEMKIGRIINRVFPGEFTTREIEKFVNEYKSEHDMITGNIEIRLVDGQDISYWYDYRKYNRDGGGTLNNSCMRDVPRNRFSMYVDNPNKIKLAIFTNRGKLEARALVWETDKGTYMDRVYYTKDHLDNAFKRYAEKNGWMFKGQRDLPPMKVELDNVDDEYRRNHPYLDTFQYRGDGSLTYRM